MGSRLLLPLALTLWLAAHLAQAAVPDAGSLPEAATPSVVRIEPMSDPAIMGAACLGLAAATVAAAYAAGPTELIVLRSGLSVVSNSVALFIPMAGILGGASCVLAAVATPSVRWMIDQSGNILDRLEGVAEEWRGDQPGNAQRTADGVGELKERDAFRPLRPIRPMTETELQSTGCVVGALSGFMAAMVTSPAEVAMLASGSIALASSTSILGLRLLATIVVGGCGIGSLVAEPVTEFVSQF